MIYLAILAAFGAGYLVHTLQKQVDSRQAVLNELNSIERICRLTEQMNHSLQLNVELLEDKKQLQKRLSDLEDQHERTLAVLN